MRRVSDGEEMESDRTACPVCGGDVEPVGILDRLEWAVCRDCGMWFSRRADEEEEEAC